MTSTSTSSRMRSCTKQAIAAGLLAALAGCGEKPQPVAAKPAAGALSVFYTCDTRGNIKPCDCTEGTAGGMSRRAAYLEPLMTNAMVLVDAGNVTAGPREWERFDLEYILKAYDAMGYDAINLGQHET